MTGSPATAMARGFAASPGIAGPADMTDAAGLPPGWVARRIPAGVWLFEEPEPAPARAVELEWMVPDPARPILVVDGRGESALEAAAAVMRSLVDQGAPRRVRLVLPGLPLLAAQRFADRHSLDVVATSGSLRIGRSHLHAWGFNAERPAEFWQWFRFVPGRRPEPFGAIYPLPAWEAPLMSRSAVPARVAGLVPYRIAAGLALTADGPADVTFLRHAAEIQPDPERITVAVDTNIGEAVVVHAVEALFEALPTGRRMRLVSPGSATSPGLRDLVLRYGAEVVAPDTAITRTAETGALLAISPHGLGHWVRLMADGRAASLGPLHPAPSWRPALRAALSRHAVAPSRHSGPLELAATPSGVWIHRPDGSSAAWLAAAVPPDGERVTITADGDPGRPADREAVEYVIGLLPYHLRASFRLVMSDADRGGPHAYGQWLANRFGALVGVASDVPAAAWEPTAPKIAVTVPAWQEFGPRT